MFSDRVSHEGVGMKSLFIVLVIFMFSTVTSTNKDAVNALQPEVDALRADLEAALNLEECIAAVFSNYNQHISEVLHPNNMWMTIPYR